MHACIYVFVYARTHARTHACMHAYVNVRIYFIVYRNSYAMLDGLRSITGRDEAQVRQPKVEHVARSCTDILIKEWAHQYDHGR